MARGGFLLIFAAVATVGAATAAAWPATADTSRTPQDPLRRGSAASYAMPDTCETLKISSKYFFYHSHIPKAGGRSFYSIFRRSPRIPGITPCRQSVYSRTSDCPMKGDPVCPQRFAEIRENFQAHGSYGDCNFLSFETPSLIASLQNELDMPDVKVMTTFREPVSHFVSQYLHDRRHGRINNNITRYINGGIGYQKRCGVGNFQMCRLGVKTLSAAKDLVSQIFHFGILEYWDASICLLYYQLGRFNRSKCANLCSDDREAVIKAHIGTAPDKQLVSAKLDLSVLRQMGDLNKVDAELYAWATQVFFARVRRVEVQENVTLLCEMHV